MRLLLEQLFPASNYHSLLVLMQYEHFKLWIYDKRESFSACAYQL